MSGHKSHLDILGITHPLLSPPEQVPFGSLQVDEGRFQIRNPKACSFSQASAQEAEQRKLRDGLQVLVKSDIELDPIIVWRDAEGRLWVIDGHHRHEALAASGICPDETVWMQLANVSSEAEARALALDINKRLHLSLHPKELLENFWRATLLGEAEGSTRERARKYQLSKGTINNVDRKAPLVLAELSRRAALHGVKFGSQFIRENAPLWRELKSFWKDFEKPRSEELQEMERKRIADALLGALGEDLKVNPELVAEVFEEVTREVSGKETHVVFSKGLKDDF